MKILKLVAENIKRITVVEITPEGNLVTIRGKNRAGKSSILQSILWAIGGAKHILAKPIRDGAEKGFIEVTLGDNEPNLIVERSFTENGSYLSVKTKDGAKYPQPQKMLDNLVGALSFDPLAFMRSDEKKQFETLRGMVDLEEDLDALDVERKAFYDDRTEANREAKSYKEQAEAIEIPEGTLDVITNTDAIKARLAKVDEHNSEVRDAHAIVERAKQAMARADDEVERLAQLLREAKTKAASAKEAYETVAAREIAELVDAKAIMAELEKAEEANRKYETKKRRDELVKKHDAAVAEAGNCTAKIEAIDKRKRDAIAAAQMPVEGLSFEEGSVTYKGLPLNQASDAEQLMVSAAIGASLNPELRVMLIRDGSLLDDDLTKALADFAKDKDWQLWMECVSNEIEGPGILMVDGHVYGQEPKEEEATD